MIVRPIIVYAFLHPQGVKEGYVGCSVGPEARRQAQLTGWGSQKVCAWMRALPCLPPIVKLAVAYNAREAAFLEWFYTNQLRRRGFFLLNDKNPKAYADFRKQFKRETRPAETLSKEWVL